MKKSKQCEQAEHTWLGKTVTCYLQLPGGPRRGPYQGWVSGLSTNEAAMLDEGGKTYDATGLLVDIPIVGRNTTYGAWPVPFDSAEITKPQVKHLGIMKSRCGVRVPLWCLVRDDMGLERYKALGKTELFDGEEPYEICHVCYQALVAWYHDPNPVKKPDVYAPVGDGADILADLEHQQAAQDAYWKGRLNEHTSGTPKRLKGL